MRSLGFGIAVTLAVKTGYSRVVGVARDLLLPLPAMPRDVGRSWVVGLFTTMFRFGAVAVASEP